MANCRPNQRGGGIIIFIENDINFSVNKNEQMANSHFILIHLNEYKTKIAGFYRSPSTKLDQFIEVLDSILDKTDNLICFGDANYDLFKPNDTNVHAYVQTLNNNNYTILNGLSNGDYTYSKDKNGYAHTSILDHIFSDKFSNSNEIKIDIIDVCFSDHRALLFHCNPGVKTNEPNKKPFTLHDFTKINAGLNELENVPNGFDTFMLKFTDIVKKCTEVKSRKPGKGDKKAWIDRDLRVELKKRNELFKIKKNNPNNLIYRTEFNKLKKKIASRITENRKKFFGTKFTESANNPKKFWRNINSLIHNKTSDGSKKFAIKNQTGQILKAKEAANAFNVHFTNLPQNTIRGW